MTNRRHFLLGSAAATAGLAAMGMPFMGGARAAPPGNALKFLFVFNSGGWDPTRVFANEYANSNVDMEPDATGAMAGNIGFVDHAMRPSVRTFFELNHQRTVVLKGVMVRSIAHEICTMIALTGTSGGTSPDWPAILADDRGSQYKLPHLVLGGPSFPGDRVVSVARTGLNGQLEDLLSGAVLERNDSPSRRLNPAAEGLVDRYLNRRAAAAVASADSAVGKALATDYQNSLAKAQSLKDLRYVMDFTGGASLADQGQVAVDALSLGIARCVTLGFPGPFGGQGWDSHANNDATQSPLWEALFNGLGEIVALLEQAPGESTERLIDETVLVVLSEMGRTPQLNTLDGKDHWPYTSMMLLGAGLQGDRVIGGYDDTYYGVPVDPNTGDATESGQVLSAEAVGATLLAMADIDPDPYVAGVKPLTGILA